MEKIINFLQIFVWRAAIKLFVWTMSILDELLSGVSGEVFKICYNRFYEKFKIVARHEFTILQSFSLGSLWLVYIIQSSAYPIIFVDSSIPLQMSVITIKKRVTLITALELFRFRCSFCWESISDFYSKTSVFGEVGCK
jgi:hypothetical protein